MIRKDIGDRKGEAAVYGNLGKVFLFLGEFGEAKRYLEKALVIRKSTGDRRGQARDCSHLATPSQSVGEHVTAKKYIEKALVIAEEIGDRHLETANFGRLGVQFYNLGEYVKAHEYLQKPLAISIEIGDRKGQALNHGDLGRVFKSRGEYVKAKEHLDKALEITKEIGDRQGEGANASSLGEVFMYLGEYSKAEEYLEKALSINKQIGVRDQEARCYEKLTTVFQSRSEHAKAQEYLEKAIEIQIKIGDSAGEAAGYAILGTVFSSLSEYGKAEEYLKKALEIKGKIGDRQGQATCYLNLGTVFINSDAYSKAARFINKAITISKEIGDRQGEAAGYGNLGTVFISLGEYVRAKEYLEKSLAISIEIGDRKAASDDYGNIGGVHQNLGEYVKAEECLQKAIAIRLQIGDKEGEARDYSNLGKLFLLLGEDVKAEEYLEKAAAIQKVIGNRLGEASSYGNLGTFFMKLGKYDKAVENFEKALAIEIKIGCKRGEAADYGNLGTVFKALGDYDKAKEHYEKALSIKVDIGDRQGEASCHGRPGTVLISLEDYFKAKECFEKALSISTDTGDREEELLSLYNLAFLKLLEGEQSEAFRYLSPIIEKCEDLRGFLEDNDQYKISFTDRNTFLYKFLSDLFCSVGKPNEALNVQELARARALGDLMSAQYCLEKQFSEGPQSWVGIEKIMKKERSSTCLYISYHDQSIRLWVVKPGGTIHFITREKNEDNFNNGSSLNVCSTKCLGRLVDCEDRSLNDVRPSITSSSEISLPISQLAIRDGNENEEHEPNFSLCYKLFIAPVADFLDNSEIIIVPDQSLHKVPFAAFIDENGRYLSDTFRIRIVPSLTTLKFIQDSPVDYHSQTGALVVGDPKVGPVRYRGKKKVISRLPFAGKEAEMIGRLLGVAPLLAENATKQAVLQRILSVSLIHLAAHGNAERGEIALSPVCPPNKTPHEKDYLLTMSDISRVQLRAKLVVLSCCHSASGRVRAEGVVGIARAFLGSGARSVLVALWAIEDTATEQFMRRFYEHLVRGESASECLHEAMKWMRGNGFSDVKQWAPFMLIGDNVTFEFGKDSHSKLLYK